MRPTPTPVGTPQPTLAPDALRRYENDIFGLTLAYPGDWVAQEGIDPELEPLLIAEASAGFPRLFLSLKYMAEALDLEKFLEEYKASLQQGLSGHQMVSEKAVQTADGTPAHEMVVDFTVGELPLRARILVAVRGSQFIELFLYTLQADFSQQSSAMEGMARSLSLLPAQPFGIPREKALTLYYPGPMTLDPHLVQDATSHFYISQIFSGLVALDRELKIIPDLAQSWDILDGGRTHLFHLRRDARFHDGRSVTAQDFKYSLERATDPALGSQTAQVYLNDIVGVKEKLAGQAREISGVEVVDDYTLRIRIDAPKVYFLAKMTYATAFVIDRRNVEAGGADWWRKPNGSGPFKLKEWRGGQAMALERNELFYRGPAQVPFVVARHFGGLPTIMYDMGEVDVAWVGLSELDKVRDPANPLSQEMKVYPELSVFYVALDTTRPPFNDPKVRRAFVLALDRDKLLSQVLKSSAEKAQGFLPPGIPGHNPNLEALPFDPTQARKLLAETAYSQGLPELTYATRALPGDAVRAMLAMWQENLGAKFTVQVAEDILGGPPPGHLLDYGWIADYPDPQNFLDVLFHSRVPHNLGGYANPQVDALLESARTEADGERRQALYRQAEKLILEDVAAIPLWHGRDYILVKPYVKNWQASPQGLPDFLGVRLER